MKKWSYWAKAHPAKARWLIVLAAILLIVLGVEMGFGLAAWDMELPAIGIVGVSAALILFMQFFPKNVGYWLSRKYHFVICIGAFLTAIAVGNLFIYEVEKMPEPETQIQQISLAQKVNQKGPSLEKNPQNIFAIGLFKTKAMIKHAKVLKSKVKSLKKRYRTLPRGLAFFLFLLAAFGGFWLAYLIGFLACAFACSEAIALALLFLLIAILAGAGTLFLVGYAFYRLFESKDHIPKKKRPHPTSDNPKG